jgi:hypothetical protein
MSILLVISQAEKAHVTIYAKNFFSIFGEAREDKKLDFFAKRLFIFSNEKAFYD